MFPLAFVFLGFILNCLSIQFLHASPRPRYALDLSEEPNDVFVLSDLTPVRKSRSLTPIPNLPQSQQLGSKKRPTSEAGILPFPPSAKTLHRPAPLLRRTSLAPHTPDALETAQSYIKEWREKFNSAVPFKERHALEDILTQAQQRLTSFLPNSLSPASTTEASRASSADKPVENSVIHDFRKSLFQASQKDLRAFSETLFQDLFSLFFNASLEHRKNQEASKTPPALFPTEPSRAQSFPSLPSFPGQRPLTYQTLHEEAASNPQTPIPDELSEPLPSYESDGYVSKGATPNAS